MAPFAATAAYAQPQARQHFDIAPQPLESALYQFSNQANMSLALPDTGLGAAHSPGVHGSHGPADAMALLLQDSGYTYVQVGPDAFRVVVAARAPTQHASTDTPVESIIVTAARRPTLLNELPRSVTHLDANALAAVGARDLNAVATSAAGFSRTNVGLGRDKIVLRGISDGALTGQSQSTVGLYLNGLRLTYAAPDPDLQLVDIRDVDILRGPQGALYGAGSIGGIVQLETNPVDLTNVGFEALVEASSVSGGRAGANVEVIANLPLVSGRLGVRLVGYDQEFGGWLNNPILGAGDTNAARRRGGRVTATFDGGDWDLSIFGVHQIIDARDAQYVRLDGEDERQTNLLEPHDNDFSAGGLVMHAVLPFGELTSTTAHVRHQLSTRYDATGSFANLGVDPAQVRPFDERQTLDILTHETRLSAPQGASTPWLLGLFYADGDNKRDNVLRDGPFGVWNDVAYSERRSEAIDELAVFGEVTWPLTARIRLSAGLRLFRFRVKTMADAVAPRIGGDDRFTGAHTNTGSAPDLRLSFQLPRDDLVYLSIARGYRGGGFNTGGAPGAISPVQQPLRYFGGDDLVATELGARLAFFDRRMSVNAALFYYRWNNIETDSLIADGFPYTGNVGDGVAYGFEVETRWRLTPNLELSANLLINEPEVKRPNVRYPRPVAGNFPGAPEFSAGLGVHFQQPSAWAGASASFYTDAQLGFSGPSALSFESSATIGGYLIGDLRFGVRNPYWDLSIYVHNILGADDRTFAYGNPYAPPGQPFTTLPSPRSFGVSLRRSF